MILSVLVFFQEKYYLRKCVFQDEIFHNEAYSQSNSSVDSSPVSSRHSIKDCTPSPKRGSFVSAVIGAIRNAATHPFMGKGSEKKPSFESAKQIQKGTHNFPNSLWLKK